MVVYKYELDWSEHQRIEVPRYSKVLNVKEQKDKAVIYVLCNESETLKSTLEVLVVPTGYVIPQTGLISYTYLDTVNIQDGNLMFHIFYKL